MPPSEVVRKGEAFSFYRRIVLNMPGIKLFNNSATSNEIVIVVRPTFHTDFSGTGRTEQVHNYLRKKIVGR